MSETFKNESKDNQNSSNTKKNKIYNSLIGPFSSKQGIIIMLSELNPILHYYYKDIIFEKLYENEEIIKIIINKEILQNYESKREINNVNSHFKTIFSLSFLFYFILLITDDSQSVNYSYPYQLIDIINQFFLENNNELYLKIIKSKIIIDLIQNYKGLEEYNKINDKNFLSKIENENVEIFELNGKKLKLGYTSKDLYIKGLDQIYADIIISLIKQYNFYECKKLEEILIKLGLDKIDITQSMIQKFSDFLIEDNKEMDKYKIRSIDDFIIANKINFYYILLKYLFKTTYLVEQIPFLLNSKESLLKSINYYLNGKSSLKFDENSKYVLEAILDNPNDSEKVLNFFKEDCIISEINEYDNKNNNSNYELYGTSSEYTVIDYITTLKGEIIEQLNDGTILCSYEKIIDFYDQSFNLKSNLKFKDLTYICEIRTNSGENNSQFAAYSKKHLTLIQLNNLAKSIIPKKNIKIKYCCSFLLDIKENFKIISGELGTTFLDEEFKEKKDYENDKIKDKSYRNGIVIDKNIIALTSRDKDIGGENKLLFYNYESNKIVYEISGYSFSKYSKSLVLFPEQKPRILMCPCEKENSREKGILFINLDILKKTDFEISKIKNDCKEYISFYNSSNFKINCFCLLFNQPIKNNSNNIKIEDKTYSQYFFAGGHEEQGGRIFGKIYLFKIEFSDSNFKLVIKKNAIDCKKIEQTITSMLLTNKNKNLLVASGGNVYIFKKPNINGYLNNEVDFFYSTN